MLCVSEAEDNDCDPLSLGSTPATLCGFHRILGLPWGLLRLAETRGQTAAFWGGG